jgi:glycosyltransferase involved in cell wall biosynthesis
MWKIKKHVFSGMENALIVTPSQWLKSNLDDSFLGCYESIIINNGIDINKFRPRDSTIKSDLNIKTKYLVLGVALSWDRRKGIDVFLKLNDLLSDDYTIVLVGVSETQKQHIPSSIICLNKTSSQDELAELYSAADVFINPTREDNFPTVNIESLACGTPVITFFTGGSPEILDASCGIIVHDGDYEEMTSAIEQICEKNSFSRKACIKRAKRYDMQDRFKDYISIYADDLK